jgi:hypothetical protein
MEQNGVQKQTKVCMDTGFMANVAVSSRKTIVTSTNGAKIMNLISSPNQQKSFQVDCSSKYKKVKQ